MSGRESEHHISCSAANAGGVIWLRRRTMDTTQGTSSSAEWLMRKRWLHGSSSSSSNAPENGIVLMVTYTYRP